MNTYLARPWRRSQVIVALICGWALLVALLFLWQLLNYRGLVAIAAEWQFNIIGRYYPILIYMIFVVIFAFPVFLLVSGRWWEEPARRTGDIEGAPAIGDAGDDHLAIARMLVGVGRFMKAMLSIAAGCAVAAVIALLAILLLPSASGAPQPIDADLTATQPSREGATLLDGTIVYSRTAALNQDVWVTRRDLRVAPVIGSGQQERTVRYFVELTGDEINRRVDQPVERRLGILKRDALPGELYHLYSYAGFNITNPYYVLYASERTLRWPHIQTAVQLLIAALCFGALGLWQWTVQRRLRRRAENL